MWIRFYNHNSQHLSTKDPQLFMLHINRKVEIFLFVNHEAQSIYGYQSLTSYCDMKSANLDLSKVVHYCMFLVLVKDVSFEMNLNENPEHIVMLSCGSITITTAYLRCSFSHLFNQPPLVQMDTIIISDEVTIFSISANYTNQAVR